MNGDVTAIVLAGGRSSRFGADKLAHDLDGRSVLDRAIDAVASVAADVIVVGAVVDRPDVRAVADPEPLGGPLQALGAALDATTTALAIVVAGDMPALVPAVLQLLVDDLEAARELDAVVLADPDAARRQPLPLAAHVEPARHAAAAALASGDRSLLRMLGRLRLAEIHPDRWLPLDPGAGSLVDIDVPDDLRRARAVAADQRKR